MVLLAMATLLVACQPATSPSPSAEPTPSPTIEPPSGAEVIDAFLEMVGYSQFAMHVVMDGTVDVALPDTTEHITISYDGDISGEDGHGDASIDVGPSVVNFEMLLVDGRAYLNDNGTWTEVPDYQQTAPLNPFAYLASPADLSYRWFEMRSGQRAHHLVSLIWLGGSAASLVEQGWTDPVVDYNLTDIWVLDDGTPLQMDFDGGVSGSYLDRAATAKFTISYVITRVGEPVEIPSPF
jgi:hypothetical protein